ncbi:MAG: heme exporter protein CcmD [Rhodospirillaceae bacterium]|nr:heme exporter protein CcmD [Rhodospirillaceae bacterium]|tara:strand:+ start:323 stop:487 length:165 start_codon:yes stop_codon:yes gene_type:complete
MTDYGIYIWSSYLVTGFTIVLVLGYSLYQLRIAKRALKDLNNDGLTKQRVADDT